MNEKTILKKDNKIRILVSIIVFIVVATILVTSYAFFTYTKTGSTNSIGTGYVSFSFDDGSSEISKGNAFPVENDDVDNTITKTFSLTGHTTYSEGLRYNVYVVYGDDVSGKTRLRDDVVSFQFVPATDGNGFTNTLNNCSSPTSLTFTNGKALVASGLIKDTTELTTKDGYTIKLWIDSSKISISSTTKRATNAEGNPSLADATSGTTTATRYMRNNSDEASTVTLFPAITSQQGKIIYTTNEFANSFYSFKMLVETTEEIITPLCKRATVLHTEECTQSSNYCYADGYTGDNTTITYGNLGTAGTLVAGDAFDCDVNGDGEVNVDGNGKSTERFYYVSPYYDTNTQTFDNTTATLIYYSNTIGGVASTGGSAYASQADLQTAYPSETFTSYDNWHGPVTAATHLPSTSQWSNITLKSTSRTILACNNGNCSNTPVLKTNNGSNTIENPFNYTGKAARLLTLPELANGCKGTINNNTSLATAGSLTACKFLFEGTKYADSSKATYGPWLETPYASNSSSVWRASAGSRLVGDAIAYSASNGVRPAIDVAISQIEY